MRAQIDRLTPWSPSDAVFGWSEPTQSGSERILVTVAATARAHVAPYLQAFSALGTRSIVVSTLAQDASGATVPIKVMDETVRPVLNVAGVRRALAAVLICGTGGITAVTAATIVGSHLGSRRTSSHAGSRSGAPPSVGAEPAAKSRSPRMAGSKSASTRPLRR